MNLGVRLRVTLHRLLPFVPLALAILLAACERASGGGSTGGKY